MYSMTKRNQSLHAARATAAAALVIGLTLTTANCAPKPPPKLAMVPLGVDTGTAGADHAAVARASDPLMGTTAKVAQCTTGDTDDIEAILRTNTCVAEPSSASLTGKVDVKVNASALEVARGGRVEFSLLLHNLTSNEVVLYMNRMSALTIEVQVLDAKGKRVDVPTGRGLPPDAPEIVAIHLKAGATITIPVPWDATRRQFNAQGSAVVNGAPLPKGAYTLRFRPAFAAGADKSDAFAPRVTVEVTP
jgi:hypothetical protein